MPEELARSSPEGIDILPDCKLQLEKLKEDLRQGFRITIEDGENSKNITVEVVTRIDDDLFFVMTDFRDWASIPEHYDPDYYAHFSCDVRRRKKLPGEVGSASLEVFKLNKSTTRYQNSNSFKIQRNKGGNLEEREFWRRYNSSVVDTKATRKYFEFRQQELTKSYKGFRRVKLIMEGSIKDHLSPSNESKALEE